MLASDATNLAQLYETRLEARRGIAGALAVSSVIVPSAPGKSAVNVGVGNFYETAVGLTVSHYFDTDNTDLRVILNGGVAYAGGSELVSRLALGVEF